MRNVPFLAIALVCLAPIAQAADAPISPRELRCEYRVDPLGVDVQEPRLSWIVQSAQRGQKQTAYQILVASSSTNLQTGQGQVGQAPPAARRLPAHHLPS